MNLCATFFAQISVRIFRVSLDPRISFNIQFHYINFQDLFILHLGTFKFFFYKNSFTRWNYISGKYVSMCSKVVVFSRVHDAKSTETVSRAQRCISSHCTFRMVEHSFHLVSIVSHFSVGLSRPSRTKSLPCLRRIHLCFPAPAFYSACTYKFAICNEYFVNDY